MKYYIFIGLLFLYGCTSTHQNVKIKKYYSKYNGVEVSSATAVVTEDVIEEVKKRRQKYLQNK